MNGRSLISYTVYALAFTAIVLLGRHVAGHTQEHPKKKRVLILGSGPAAATAALYAARAGLETIMLEGTLPGGQPSKGYMLHNWPGIQAIDGTTLMLNMHDHAKSLGAQCVAETATALKSVMPPFVVTTHSGKDFTADALIIATGSAPKKLRCAGEDAYLGKGVAVCAMCDGALFKDKPVTVVGNGTEAAKEVSTLCNHTRDITIVNPEEELRLSEDLKRLLQKNPTIKILNGCSPEAIVGTPEAVTGLTVRTQTNERKTIPTCGIFAALGKEPATNIFGNVITLDQKKRIVTSDITKTSVPGIFAAGDVTDSRVRGQVLLAAASGCLAAMDAIEYLKTH